MLLDLSFSGTPHLHGNIPHLHACSSGLGRREFQGAKELIDSFPRKIILSSSGSVEKSMSFRREPRGPHVQVAVALNQDCSSGYWADTSQSYVVRSRARNLCERSSTSSLNTAGPVVEKYIRLAQKLGRCLAFLVSIANTSYLQAKGLTSSQAIPSISSPSCFRSPNHMSARF